MSSITLFAFILVIVLVVYLTVALLKPEIFS